MSSQMNIPVQFDENLLLTVFLQMMEALAVYNSQTEYNSETDFFVCG